MSDSTIIVLLVAIAALLIFAVFQCKEYIKRVEANSKAIDCAKKLNTKYVFYNDIQRQYSFKKICDSKKSFDRFDYSDYLLALIDSQFSDFEALVSKIESNQRTYKEYLQEYNAIALNPTRDEAQKSNVPLMFFKILEQRIYEIFRQSPMLSTSVRIQVSYTSPQGKNSYSGAYVFDFEKLKLHTQEVNNANKRKQTREYQRYLMTDSLRYDILRRDNFTCLICGAERKEGIKLHVDHIHPVSRGGKTIPENLRTLCDRCNLGKGAKTEI
jgi:hypothetical protein